MEFKINFTYATIAFNAKAITKRQFDFYQDCAVSFLAGTFWQEHGDKANAKFNRFRTLNAKIYQLAGK